MSLVVSCQDKNCVVGGGWTDGQKEGQEGHLSGLTPHRIPPDTSQGNNQLSYSVNNTWILSVARTQENLNCKRLYFAKVCVIIIFDEINTKKICDTYFWCIVLQYIGKKSQELWRKSQKYLKDIWRISKINLNEISRKSQESLKKISRKSQEKMESRTYYGSLRLSKLEGFYNCSVSKLSYSN